MPAAGTPVSLHPFVATTISGGQFAEGTRWYTLKFKNTTLAAAADDGTISEVVAMAGSIDSELPEQPDNQLWCFVGNETEGYTVYNKAFGTSKALVATDPATNTAELQWRRWKAIRSVPSGGFPLQPTSLLPLLTLSICS